MFLDANAPSSNLDKKPLLWKIAYVIIYTSVVCAIAVIGRNIVETNDLKTENELLRHRIDTMLQQNDLFLQKLQRFEKVSKGTVVKIITIRLIQNCGL